MGLSLGVAKLPCMLRAQPCRQSLSVLTSMGSACYLVVLGMVWGYFCCLTVIWGSP